MKFQKEMFEMAESIVFNESGAALNLRVESDARDAMVLVDGTANKVYAGVDGAVSAADARMKILQFDASGQMGVLQLDQQDEDERVAVRLNPDLIAIVYPAKDGFA